MIFPCQVVCKSKASPYFFGMILMEHVILKMQGKAGIRLNDGIMSVANGFMMVLKE